MDCDQGTHQHLSKWSGITKKELGKLEQSLDVFGEIRNLSTNKS